MKKLLLLLSLVVLTLLTIPTAYAYKLDESADHYFLYFNDYADFQTWDKITETPAGSGTFFYNNLTTGLIQLNGSKTIYIKLPAEATRTEIELSLYNSDDSLTYDFYFGDFYDDLITDPIDILLSLESWWSVIGVDMRDYDFTAYQMTIYFGAADGLSQLASEYTADLYYNNTSVYHRYKTFRVEFYDRLNLIDTQEIIGADFADIVVPSLALPPAGYKFSNWDALVGTLDVLDALNSMYYDVYFDKVDYTRSFNYSYQPISVEGAEAYSELTPNFFHYDQVDRIYVLKLYAKYTPTTTGVYVEPTMTPTDPGGLLGILGTIGFDTDVGLTLLFIGIIFLAVIMLTLLKMPIIVHLVTITALTILFLFLGFLPIFVGVIVIIVLVILFFSVNSSSGGYA